MIIKVSVISKIYSNDVIYIFVGTVAISYIYKMHHRRIVCSFIM